MSDKKFIQMMILGAIGFISFLFIVSAVVWLADLAANVIKL